MSIKGTLSKQIIAQQSLQDFLAQSGDLQHGKNNLQTKQMAQSKLLFGVSDPLKFVKISVPSNTQQQQENVKDQLNYRINYKEYINQTQIPSFEVITKLKMNIKNIRCNYSD